MISIDYHNIPLGTSKKKFALTYIYNIVRTFWLFHVRYPWIRYNGFVRVMKYTSFARRKIELGKNVQFGKFCSIASNLKVGNNVLIAGRVCFLAGNDHSFDCPGQLIWDSPRGEEKTIVVEDDVWIGNGVNIMGGVTIGRGSVIAAGAVVTKSVPPCEVWGGVPARKIRDRFKTEEEKLLHLEFLKSLNS